LPGGHLEFGESFFECAKREVLEETGLSVSNFRVLAVTNDIMEMEKKHYVTIFVCCSIKEGTSQEPKVTLFLGADSAHVLMAGLYSLWNLKNARSGFGRIGRRYVDWRKCSRIPMISGYFFPSLTYSESIHRSHLGMIQPEMARAGYTNNMEACIAGQRCAVVKLSEETSRREGGKR
jgi:hypothetical protein